MAHDSSHAECGQEVFFDTAIGITTGAPLVDHRFDQNPPMIFCSINQHSYLSVRHQHPGIIRPPPLQTSHSDSILSWSRASVKRHNQLQTYPLTASVTSAHQHKKSVKSHSYRQHTYTLSLSRTKATGEMHINTFCQITYSTVYTLQILMNIRCWNLIPVCYFPLLPNVCYNNAMP